MKNQSFQAKKCSIVIGIFFFIFSFKAAAQFANGADIGWLSQMEASGYKFYNDSGIEKDCMQILKEKGINSLRFRVWVNPTATGGWCGKKDVATMALRAKNMGFRIMIDFHYSDWWADPGKQTKPAAWENDTLGKLLNDIYNHTYDVLDTLKSLSVIPEWVQIGNETNDGMLWPDGRASKSMKNFASMVTSGYNAVKAVDSSMQVIVHISNGYDNTLFRWMFDGLKTNGVKWDIIGMSLYPYWSNLPWVTANIQCLSNMKDMIARYQKKVMIVETGYIYSQPIAANNFLLDLITKTKSINGLGVFYWEPECYNWQGYNLGAWNANGRPSLAMDAFLGIKDSLSTSIPQAVFNELGISIYPNPLSGKELNIKLDGLNGTTTIRLVTTSGQVISSGTYIDKELVVLKNLDLMPGMYFVAIENANQKLMKPLIVK
jgi:arabinogalactan endo-1,4-beta-galactosidase